LRELEARSKRVAAMSRDSLNGGALVVGNPSMPHVATSDGRTVTLSPLSGAEQEAQWVAQRLGVTPLRGSMATEQVVRARLSGASLVHLATHGFAFSSDDHVRQSFLAFAPGDGQDGTLTVGEILDDATLTLRADLVVLSACQTALGDLKQAEGTVGLQRAFVAKGARALLVSLWSISDDATTLLMRRFYTHWLDDPGHQNKAEALRRAQADVRSDPRFEHPRYWAAFQLIGAP
jgi:CHAT domain-containing protein